MPRLELVNEPSATIALINVFYRHTARFFPLTIVIQYPHLCVSIVGCAYEIDFSFGFDSMGEYTVVVPAGNTIIFSYSIGSRPRIGDITRLRCGRNCLEVYHSQIEIPAWPAGLVAPPLETILYPWRNQNRSTLSSMWHLQYKQWFRLYFLLPL